MHPETREIVLKRVDRRGVALVAAPDEATVQSWQQEFPAPLSTSTSLGTVDGQMCWILEVRRDQSL
jgi:hypothetical protein